MKLLLKWLFLAVYHDFHWVLAATKLLTAKRHSLYVTELESEILERFGVGHFTSDSATLLTSLSMACYQGQKGMPWRPYVISATEKFYS